MALNTKQKVLNLKLKKTPSGINGFDEITMAVCPKVVLRSFAGTQAPEKTVISMEFLVKGALNYNEPGVFMSFEETKEELITNTESLHFDLDSLIKKGKIYIEYLEIDKSQNIAAGRYDLEGLFVRLQNAITGIGAKRVVLDSIDALFYGLDNNAIRPEIKRLLNG